LPPCQALQEAAIDQDGGIIIDIKKQWCIVFRLIGRTLTMFDVQITDDH
jgi:plasmid maintenance system killer protein